MPHECPVAVCMPYVSKLHKNNAFTPCCGELIPLIPRIDENQDLKLRCSTPRVVPKCAHLGLSAPPTTTIPIGAIGAVVQALAAAAQPPGGSLSLTSGQQFGATLGFEPSFVPISAMTLDFPFSSLIAWPAQKGTSIYFPTWPDTVAGKPRKLKNLGQGTASLFPHPPLPSTHLCFSQPAPRHPSYALSC